MTADPRPRRRLRQAMHPLPGAGVAAGTRPPARRPVRPRRCPPRSLHPNHLPRTCRLRSTRKKIPFWAMPMLAFLPVWAIIYVGGLSPADTGEPTQLELGAEIYAGAVCQLPRRRRRRRRRPGLHRRRGREDLPRHHRPARLRVARQQRHRPRRHALRRSGPRRRTAPHPQLQRQPDARLPGRADRGRAAGRRALRTRGPERRSRPIRPTSTPTAICFATRHPCSTPRATSSRPTASSSSDATVSSPWRRRTAPTAPPTRRPRTGRTGLARTGPSATYGVTIPNSGSPRSTRSRRRSITSTSPSTSATPDATRSLSDTRPSIATRN